MKTFLTLSMLTGTAVVAASDSPNLTHDGWKRVDDLRLVTGFSAPLDSARAKQMDENTGASSQQSLLVSEAPGWRAGLRADRQAFSESGFGWLVGVELGYDRHRGTITQITDASGDLGPGSRAELDTASLILHLGPTWWFHALDEDLRVLPGAWRIELVPRLGAGFSRARLNPGSGGWSWSGSSLGYGVAAVLAVRLAHHWEIATEFAYDSVKSDVTWGGTRDATLRAQGFTTGLQLIRLF